MAWFRKNRSLKIETKAKSSVPVAPGSFLNYVLTGGGRVTAYQAMLFYQENSAIATAVDLIAGAFEQIRPVLEVTNSKGVKSFDDSHEIIQLLRRPNGFQTWKEFSGQLSRHYLLKHDSHIAGLGNVKRPPLELYAVKPQNVSTIEDSRDGYPGSYSVPQGAGHGTYSRVTSPRNVNFYDGNLKELYHILGFSSRSNNVEGDSPLEAAALEAKQQIEGRIHNLQMIQQGGRLSLVFAFKDDERMDDDTHQERKKRINEDLAGSTNAGKIAVISGSEVDIREFSKSNKDMDYVKLDESASKGIYLRYNVPLPLVTVSASTFNNLSQAVEHLYDFAVLPMADILLCGLSVMLLPRYKLDPATTRITYDPDSITALRGRMLDEVEKRKKMNIETTNELRAGLPGRESIEGGDILYQAANLVPVGTDLFTDDNDPGDEAKKLLKRDGLN